MHTLPQELCSAFPLSILVPKQSPWLCNNSIKGNIKLFGYNACQRSEWTYWGSTLLDGNTWCCCSQRSSNAVVVSEADLGLNCGERTRYLEEWDLEKDNSLILLPFACPQGCYWPEHWWTTDDDKNYWRLFILKLKQSSYMKSFDYSQDIWS